MNNEVTFLKDNFKDIIYIGGAIVSFFVGNRIRKVNLKKEETNVQSGELENVEAALKIYRLMLTDLQDKLSKAEEAYKIIEDRLHESINERKRLAKENIELKNKLDVFTSNNKQI